MTLKEESTAALLEKMRAAVRGGRAAIVPHTNPDPDALASAFGLAHLFRERFGVSATIFYGGVIGRAENRAFVSELKIPLKKIAELDLRRWRTIAVVDTQPGAGNLPLPKGTLPAIVLDHHLPARREMKKVCFADLRSNFCATSTIVTAYLREAGVQFTPRLATALFWGIKTDTYDLGREATPADIDAYVFLLPMIDHVRLARIEHPVVSREYFVRFHECLGGAELHGDALTAWLTHTPYPDITAEIADWLCRLRSAKWALVAGVHEREIHFSVRTRERTRDAARVAMRLAGRHGSAGGHGMIAGGTIPIEHSNDEREREKEIHADFLLLKKRFLAALKINADAPGARLVPERAGTRNGGLLENPRRPQ